MGLSAASHLLGLAAICSHFAVSVAVDAIDRQSVKPYLVVPISPIVTSELPYDDTSTRRMLIGA